ncbi:hypothetical protein [Paraburkholderia domus]|uniref:hypothetical protein n=1 Tax=Paraburkholderia domus TaxID=2793075 RepID=UPI001B8B5FD6|nr:hypothetical protein [Paraburkholderia domus]
MKQLDELTDNIDNLEQQREELGLPVRRGMTIAVEFKPRKAYDYGSVEWKKDGIELLTVIAHDDHDVVVLHVPDGKLSAFAKRISEYIEVDVK